ncbi:MAG: nicotinate-nucleotide adenylyltransferase [Parvularcula sp.]
MIESPDLARGLRVGVLGGSFNPAHQGHLEISQAARRALGLDRVWWLVSPQNPLKDPGQYASLDQRLDGARAFAAGRPWLSVSDYERVRGTQYTADTLAALRRDYPQTRLVWMMGADNLAQFHHWARWQEIAAMVPLCVVSRPGSTLAALKSPAALRLARARVPLSQARSLADRPAPAWIFLPLVHNPISSTALRKRGV